MRYNVSHDYITQSVLNYIIKRPIEYILHRRQSGYDSDIDQSDSEGEEIIDNNEKTIIENNLQSMINDIPKEKSISNNLKQLLIDDLLKQSMINKTINNKESMINDILNKNAINNNSNENTINNNINAFVETPKCIRFKKAVFNPKNNDNKSFQYSITLSLYHIEIGNNFNRITKLKPYTNNFNWNNTNFPPIKQDYKNFEINNDKIVLNIYQLNNKKISQIYKSNYD